MKRFLVSITTLGALIMLINFPVQSEDLSRSIYSSQDATIEAETSNNYGGSEHLISSSDGGKVTDFILKFALDDLPSNVVIEEASLELTQMETSGNDILLNAYKVTSLWKEGTVTGTSKPSFDNTFRYGVISADSTLGKKNLSLNLSDLVQYWIDNPSKNFGLIFIPEEEIEGDYDHKFGSKESSSKPVLSVKYLLIDEDPPKILNISSKDINSTTVEISWETDEEASSFVEYGEDTNYGNLVGDDVMVKAHKVTLKYLKEGTTYHYKVISEDNGNKAESEDKTFKTLEVQPGDQEDKETLDSEGVGGIMPPINIYSSVLEEDEMKFVVLKWEYSVEDEIEGFNIYKSIGNDQSYSLLSRVEKEGREYKDYDVTEGMTYYYTLRTIKDGLESKDSEGKKVTVYKSKVEEELHKLDFWKGFLLLNIVIAPIFITWYFINKRKRGTKQGSRKSDKPKKKGRK